jgi:hypothetical protein
LPLASTVWRSATRAMSGPIGEGLSELRIDIKRAKVIAKELKE